MKKYIKNLVVSAIAAVLSLSISIPAFAYNKDNLVTMGYLEQRISDYLDENHPEIEIGTIDFIDYIMDVLLSDGDEELMKYDDYNDLKYFMGEYLYQLELYQCETGSSEGFALSDEYKNLTVEEIKEQVREKDLEIKKMEMGESNAPVPYARFNADAVAEYAKKYARRYNNEYNIYLKDCTNFASQSLHAGGLDMDIPSTVPIGIKDTTSYWYSIKYEEWHGNNSVPAWNETSSWVGVEDLYSYCRKNGAEVRQYSTLTSLAKNIEVGDIVQLRNEDGNWYHSVIISDYINGEYTYCGHTSNRKDEPISTMSGAGAYRYIRFS